MFILLSFQFMFFFVLKKKLNVSASMLNAVLS